MWARAALLLAWALIGVAGAQQAALDSKPALYVCVQHDVRAHVLEKALRAKLVGLNVFVFGRFRDFEAASSSRPADALLTMVPVLEHLGHKATLRGVRDGKDWETYSLVSLASTQGPLTGKTIGVVDLLGREATQAFVSSLLGHDVKVTRVAKLEDLLPLLKFSMADAILIPTAAYPRQAELTRLPLVVKELKDARVGLPSIAVLRVSTHDPIVRAVQALDPASMALLGLTGWRAP